MSEAEKNELRRKNNESQKRRREKKRIAMLAENLISDSMTENPILFKEEPSETDCEYTGVVPGGAGGAMAPPDFGTSVNPISAKGGRLFPPNNTGTPGFSDLPTALHLGRATCTVHLISAQYQPQIYHVIRKAKSLLHTVSFQVFCSLSVLFSKIADIFMILEQKNC